MHSQESNDDSSPKPGKVKFIISQSRKSRVRCIPIRNYSRVDEVQSVMSTFSKDSCECSSKNSFVSIIFLLLRLVTFLMDFLDQNSNFDFMGISCVSEFSFLIPSELPNSMTVLLDKIDVMLTSWSTFFQ